MFTQQKTPDSGLFRFYPKLVLTRSDVSVYGLGSGLLSMWVHYKATGLVRTFPRAKTFRPLNGVDDTNGVVWVGDSNNADSYAHCIL